MSTVASLNRYAEIRGITNDIVLISDSQDMEFIRDYVKPDVMADFPSYMVYIADSDVKLIWGISTYIPWLNSYAELVYSDSALRRKIARRKTKK